MTPSSPMPRETSLPQTLQNILEVGSLTRQEHFDLVTLCLSDLSVTEEERRQINHIFDELQLGQLKIVS